MTAPEQGPARWVLWAMVAGVVAISAAVAAKTWNDRHWDRRIAATFGTDPEELLPMLKRDFPEDYRTLREAVRAHWRADRRSEPELHSPSEAWSRAFVDSHWDVLRKAPAEYIARWTQEDAAVQRRWAATNPEHCVHVLTHGREGVDSRPYGPAPDRSFRLLMQTAKAGRETPVAHGRATSVDLDAYERDAADPTLWRDISASVPGSEVAGSNARRCVELSVRYQALAEQPPDRLARLMQGSGPDVRYRAVP
jgi:hypothetical protein